MHKSFYASGFLYNLKSKQILLLQKLQKDDTASIWSMLGGDSVDGEDGQVTFQRIVYELLNVDLKIKHIYPVYDYFNEELNKVNYVFYTEVGKSLIFNPINNDILSWVSFQETPKLLFSPRTKQDVVVGQRVINLKERIDEAGRDNGYL